MPNKLNPKQEKKMKIFMWVTFSLLSILFAFLINIIVM